MTGMLIIWAIGMVAGAVLADHRGTQARVGIMLTAILGPVLGLAVTYFVTKSTVKDRRPSRVS